MLGGAWVVSDNQITHTGFPATQPPRTAGLGPGHGIVAVQLHDISIRGNIVSHGRGDVYVRHTPEQQVCILNTTYKRQISADRIEFELFPRPVA